MQRLFVLILLLVPGLALASSPTAAEILAQSKAASGGELWNTINSLHIKGKIIKGGLSGTADKTVDIHGGRSVSHYTIGPYRAGQGYDGKTGWTQAPSGEISPEDSAAAQEADITQAYIAARGYWFPERWPAQIVLLGPHQDGEDSYEVLQITPQGGDPFELWINSDTHLVDRTVMSTPTGHETHSFNEYLSVNGVQIPFHQWIYDDQHNYTIYQYDAASVNRPIADNDFAMPQQNLSDFAFLNGGNQATLPFYLISDHVYLAASVNGKPLQLELSTADANLLTEAAAEKAGVKSAGSFNTSGTSDKTLAVSAARLNSLTLGDQVVLSNQLFRVATLPGFNGWQGATFDGLVGFELFKRFVVQINYAYHKLTLILPQNFNPSNAGQAVPFTLTDGRIPTVTASIDGISGQFAVNTNSRSALSLGTAFVTQHKLLARYQTSPETVIGWGVRGAVTGRVARGGVLTFGGVSVQDPVLDLNTTTAGDPVGKGLAGIIGGELLKRFTVTFDYANQRIYFQANKDSGTPMDYDRAGLWINQQGKDFVVEAVMPGGPAEQAGIKPGDLITAMGDKTASSLTLDDLRTGLSEGAPGSSVKLGVAQGGTSKWITVVLQRLIPAEGGPRKAA